MKLSPNLIIMYWCVLLLRMKVNKLLVIYILLNKMYFENISLILGQLPRSVDVVCEYDLVDLCKPGDRVQIVGNYRCLPNKQGSFTSGTFRFVEDLFEHLILYILALIYLLTIDTNIFT